MREYYATPITNYCYSTCMVRLVVVLVITFVVTIAPAQRTVDEPRVSEDTISNVLVPIETPTRGYLMIMCDRGPDSFDVIRIGFLGTDYISERKTSVTYRVDSLPPVTQTWISLSRSVYTRTGEQTQSLLAAMLSGQKFELRYEAHIASISYEFSLIGVRRALQSNGCYTGPL